MTEEEIVLKQITELETQIREYIIKQGQAQLELHELKCKYGKIIKEKNKLTHLYTIRREEHKIDFVRVELTGLFISKESAQKYIDEKEYIDVTISTYPISRIWDGKEKPNWKEIWTE